MNSEKVDELISKYLALQKIIKQAEEEAGFIKGTLKFYLDEEKLTYYQDEKGNTLSSVSLVRETIDKVKARELFGDKIDEVIKKTNISFVKIMSPDSTEMQQRFLKSKTK